MTKRSFKPRAELLALAVALVLVLNPEIRALLLLANAIGMETIALLLLLQARTVWPVITTGTRRSLGTLCPVVAETIQSTGRFVVGLLWSRQSLALPIAQVSLHLGNVKCPGV
jgi:hypothetical protein